MRVTFCASSVELYCDGSVGEAGIPLEFTGIVVCLVVAAADWTVDLGTDCVADTLRFWLIFGVTVSSIRTIESFTVGSYKSNSKMAEHETRRLICSSAFNRCPHRCHLTIEMHAVISTSFFQLRYV